MTTTKPVTQTFSTVDQDRSSLGVFVKFAIDGVGDDPGFGGERLGSAVEVRGAEAARDLMRYLKGLPAMAKCATAEEFVLGYVPTSEQSRDDLAKWDALQAEVFSIMMADFQADSYDLGKRLIAAIRQASDFASPRLRAWGVTV
jgi:hypothetical protein